MQEVLFDIDRPKAYTPYPRQQESIDKALDFFHGNNKKDAQVLVGPTGYGKSIIIGYLSNHLDEGFIVLQPSVDLLKQNYEKFLSYGGNGSIYSASMKQKRLSKAVYCTLGSIKKDVAGLRRMGVKYVIVDECHYKFSPKKGSEFRTFLDELNPQKILGLTATPIRLKSGALKIITRTVPKIFKGFVDIIQIQDIMENHWTPLQYYRYDYDKSQLRLKSSKTSYTEESIKKSSKINNVNNNIYLFLKKSLETYDDFSAIVYVDSIATADKMNSLFPEESTVVHSKLKDKDRFSSINQFKSGSKKIIFNVGILIVGFDYPPLSHVIIGFPTNSYAIYYQIIGRVIRKSENKKIANVVDFCGNLDKFGRVEDMQIVEVAGKMEMVSKGYLITSYYLDETAPSIKEIEIKESYKKRKRLMQSLNVRTGKVNKISEEDRKISALNKNGYKVISFGPYKGTHLSQVPLLWMKKVVREYEMNTGVERMIKNALLDEIRKRRASV